MIYRIFFLFLLIYIQCAWSMMAFRIARSNGNVAIKSNSGVTPYDWLSGWLTDWISQTHTHTHNAEILLMTIATTRDTREKAMLFINGHTSNAQQLIYSIFSLCVGFRLCVHFLGRVPPPREKIKNRWQRCRWQKPKSKIEDDQLIHEYFTIVEVPVSLHRDEF